MHYPGKAPPSFVEPHRLEPDASSRQRGLVPIDGATLAALHAIRRRPPPRDRVRFTLALVAALVLHIVLVFIVRYEMQPRVQVSFANPNEKPDVLEVRFIEPSRPPPPVADVPPPPPVAEPPPKVRSPEATRPEPPLPKKKPEEEQAPPDTTTPAAASQAPNPDLFGADGSIAMPKTGAGSKPDFVPHAPVGDAGIMSHKTTVTYTETRFEKDWAPRDENALSQGVRKVIEKTTVKKTVDMGRGTRINCSTVLFVLPVGCGGEDPSKASKKDGDVRLNMAPANPLVKDLPDQPTPPTEAQCIAAFRADKPLPQGCATDTPIKAMDQENAERERRTGK
ncbi:MAG: hypothetical protein ABWX83_11165 [Luteibacter sp.]